MKPTLRKALLNPDCSFVVRKDIGENMKNYWQYHPEYEIMYIKKSIGTCIIGDYIGTFESGDILVLGPNLPHSLRHRHEYLRNMGGEEGEAIIVLFREDALGNSFFDIPETQQIRQVLAKAVYGMKVNGIAKKRVAKLMEKMLHCSPGRKVLTLLDILLTIAESEQYETLMSKGSTYSPSQTDNQRINMVYEYTSRKYGDEIRIEDIAQILHMTRFSFCRFFKRITKKSYVQFLKEVRIANACKALIKENQNVTEVGYSCGYNNISHFNRQFKEIKHMTPIEYKRKYITSLT